MARDKHEDRLLWPLSGAHNTPDGEVEPGSCLPLFYTSTR